jgi:cytochrome c-type biogenesis protein CcmH/NrfF
MFAAVGECLEIVKNSQLENARANDEVRALNCQVHALKEHNAALAKQLNALITQLHDE